MLEQLVPLSDIVISISSLIAAFFAFRAFMYIRTKGKSKTLVGWLETVFLLLTVGFIIWAVGEVSWAIILYGMGLEPYPSIADLFYVLGYLPLIVGFAYLWHKISKSKQMSSTEIIKYTGIGLLVSGVVYYLLTTFIMGFQEGGTTMEVFLNYFYPIASAVLFMVTLRAYSFFGSGHIKQALMLISLGIFFYFVADIWFTYLAWNEIETGVLSLWSNSAYVIGDLFAIGGFIELTRKK